MTIDMNTAGSAKEMTIEAVIIRADGRREPLGTVAYWHRNPLRRLMHKVSQIFKGA